MNNPEPEKPLHWCKQFKAGMTISEILNHVFKHFVTLNYRLESEPTWQETPGEGIILYFTFSSYHA